MSTENYLEMFKYLAQQGNITISESDLNKFHISEEDYRDFLESKREYKLLQNGSDKEYESTMNKVNSLWPSWLEDRDFTLRRRSDGSKYDFSLVMNRAEYASFCSMKLPEYSTVSL